MLSKKIYELKELMEDLSLDQTFSDMNSIAKARKLYVPPLCSIFEAKNITTDIIEQYKFKVDVNSEKQLSNISDSKILQLCKTRRKQSNLFKKKKIGVLFSGGPSPGGHNVIAGLFDALKKSNPDSSLLGFVRGFDGLMEGNYIKLTNDLVNNYRNQGGFSMIGTSRAKIDTPEKIYISKQTLKRLNLDAIVVVGGDDSNTNAAFLAQEMFNDNISVIGVPKSIDGDVQIKDLRGKILCPTSFGFHTTSRAFSHFISNLCVDAESDTKYWHICKVMGRSASHIALEVALQTHVNLTIIGEEIADYVDTKKQLNSKKNFDFSIYGMTLNKLVKLISEIILKRAKVGKNFGVIVIPEGILEFINEIQIIIIKINQIIADYNLNNRLTFHDIFKTLEEKLEYLEKLADKKCTTIQSSFWSTKDNKVLISMPMLLQKGLLTERDSHGNFQFSQIQTEQILMDLVKSRLQQLRKEGKYLIGIEKKYYLKTLKNWGLDGNVYGPVLFKNWDNSKKLLFKSEITSRENLIKKLVKNSMLNEGSDLPKPIDIIFQKSIPKFKTQAHFYGYVGRGERPSNFDCTYAYNLGQIAFHLLNNGATGQMASILNLSDPPEKWIPMGIPLAFLMNLEERKGDLTLVFGKTMLDLKSPAFGLFKALREKWLSLDSNIENYRIVDSMRPIGEEHERPITMLINKIGQKN